MKLQPQKSEKMVQRSFPIAVFGCSPFAHDASKLFLRIFYRKINISILPYAVDSKNGVHMFVFWKIAPSR